MDKGDRGTLTTLIAGVGSLVVLVIITLVIVSTMINADLFTRGTYTVNEENGTVFLNATGYQLKNYSARGEDYTIIGILNWTSGKTIDAANWTFNAENATLTNATAIAWGNVSINYSFTYRGNLEQAPSDLAWNMTGGVDNVSEKLPTILLIAAVVLLFGVLVILVLKARDMGIGTGDSL